MKRILGIGNSHIAALMFAAKDAPERWADFEFSWFGAHKAGLAQLRISRDAIHPDGTDAARSFSKFRGSLEPLDTSNIDAFVITGGQISLMNMMRLYREARFYPLPSIVNAEDLSAMSPLLMSRAAFGATLRSMIATRMGLTFAAALRSITNKPVVLAVQPFATQAVMKAGPDRARLYKRMVRSDDAAMVAAEFTRAFRTVTEQHDVIALPQPHQTVRGGAMTAEQFTRGSLRMSVKGRHRHDEDDLLHANAAYGALVLDQVAGALAA